MKRFLLLIVSIGLSFSATAQETVIFQESFETNGHTSRYTVSSSGGFNDGSSDHFNRTDGSGIANVSGSYTGFLGKYFFAAEDTDDDGGDSSDEQTIVISGIDISGFSNLQISGLFAAGNEGGAGASAYDANDYIQVNYAIDGGLETNGIHFRYFNNGDAFNEPIGLDSDHNGEADGATLNTSLTRFTSSIGSTGSSMTITIRVFMDAGNEEIAFDNIQVIGTQSGKIVSITGSEGWRLIAAPLSSMTFDNYLGNLWTQGFTNADATGGTSNVYSYDETVTTGDLDDGFSSITDQTSGMSQGLGYAVYVYSDDNGPGVAGDAGFPKTISLSGTAPTSDVGPVTVNFTSSGTASNDGWNLFGNPFASDLNVGLLGLEDNASIDNFAYVYHSSTSSYSALEAAASDSSTDQIATGQGFFIKSSAATTYTFPVAAIGTGASFLKSGNPTLIRSLDFTLLKETFSSEATVRFHSKADFGKDPYDGYYLKPLGSEYVGIFSLEDGDAYSYNSMPYNIDGLVEVPLDLISTESGEFELNWVKPINFPDNWVITLKDNITDTEIKITEEGTYKFQSEVAAKSKSASALNPQAPEVLNSSKDSRFTLIVSQTTSVNNEEEGKVKSFALSQNYPNPFNPTTTINYSVENAGPVTISIYNLMGQKVAELVNESKAAGSYNVTWNAANAASGMYYYRLESSGQTLTRKMTLIK